MISKDTKPRHSHQDCGRMSQNEMNVTEEFYRIEALILYVFGYGYD